MNKENISIRIIQSNGVSSAEANGEGECSLVYGSAYEEDDQIVVEITQAPAFLVIQLDDAVGESMIYMKEKSITYVVPFGEKKISFSPKSFWGEKHLLVARYATLEEIAAYRNLSENRYDYHEAKNYFPHASANVETRGESVFAARNAINGNHQNTSHGEWPYESWGINCDPEARMRIEFGRRVTVDKLVFYLRADFPHDSWWKEAKVSCSDGSEKVIHFEKTKSGQDFAIAPRKIEWLEISNLKKAEDDSPFPALTQIEVYGIEA